jgi:6-phosphogluconolactonase (cycloisomerase 2 family)
MLKRFAWLLGVVVLVAIGLLVACSNKYNPSQDGLVLVGSQGSGLIETFTFSLNTGTIFSIENSPIDTSQETCVLNGLPSSIVLDPAGAYAYTIVNKSSVCPGSATGILAFKVNSDGTLTKGSLTNDPNPVALAMDSTGKYLFVAEGSGVNSYALSNGSLTLVPGTYTLPPTIQPANLVALAVTPTVLPPLQNGVQVAVCSSPGNNPPTNEFLYAVDSVNYLVWEFQVDMSTGALGNPTGQTAAPSFSTDQVPIGVTVDPCDRFVYVADSYTNKVSAYTICSQASLPKCPNADGTLLPVANSPFSLSGSANQPGPLLTDPFGNYLYVLNTRSGTISVLRISPVSGSLTPGVPAQVSTGQYPSAMAIRADDNWLFVSNFQSGTITEFAIIPATGGLTGLPAVITDNWPTGIAVK